MNKKLIALAIAGLVSMPALADSSNVTLYGMLDAGVDNVSNVGGSTGTTNSTNNAGRVSDYGSYFGLKGSENVGSGTSAIWQIEQGVAVNGGNSTGPGGLNGGGTYGTSPFGSNQFNNQRNTFVGLSNQDAGTVLVGIHDTPYKMATANMDPFADTLGDYNGLVGSFSQAGSYGNGVGAFGGAGASDYFDLRPSQVLAYVSPTYAGATLIAAYVFGGAQATGTAGQQTGDAQSYALEYDASKTLDIPLYLTASYEQHNFGSNGTGTLGFGTGSLTGNSVVGGTLGAGFGLGGRQNSAWKLGASYTLMGATLSALYEDSTDNFNNGSNVFGHSTWYGSVKYPIGAFDIALAFASSGNDNTSTTVSTGATQTTIGGDYNFSKNTQVYVLYTSINNDAGAMYNFADTTAPVAFASAVGGATINAYSLGLKHSF
ncbi:MAG: porin [Betaproteobacteria bacterium]|nr:porin [Betaproteobacteria bacterium]